MAAVSPAWGLRSSDTLISGTGTRRSFPVQPAAPPVAASTLMEEKGFLPVRTCPPLIPRHCSDFVPSGLLTGIVHDVQVVGQLGAGQVVLVRIT